MSLSEFMTSYDIMILDRRKLHIAIIWLQCSVIFLPSNAM